jgi:hypothetical protein
MEEAMRKFAFILVAVASVLGLTACYDQSDITGVNTGQTASTSAPRPTPAASETGPEAQANAAALVDRQHKIAQPARSQICPQKKPTPTPTP